jgi:RNA polymerase sigma-70 factor, ECF subfamily
MVPGRGRWWPDTVAPITAPGPPIRSAQAPPDRPALGDGASGQLHPVRDDDAVITQARAGDRQALETLLRSHYDPIYAVCRRMTGNDADAADAAQEALIAIVRGMPRFDDRSRFSTWAYRIAVNCSIDELRRRARRRAVSLEDHPAAATAAPMWVARPEEDPEAAADRLDVDTALRQLPPEFRAAVVLRDLCRLDYTEIAEVLQVPPGTVRSRIARGRGLLVRLLDANRTPP